MFSKRPAGTSPQTDHRTDMKKHCIVGNVVSWCFAAVLLLSSSLEMFCFGSEACFVVWCCWRTEFTLRIWSRSRSRSGPGVSSGSGLRCVQPQMLFVSESDCRSQFRVVCSQMGNVGLFPLSVLSSDWLSPQCPLCDWLSRLSVCLTVSQSKQPLFLTGTHTENTPPLPPRCHDLITAHLWPTRDQSWQTSVFISDPSEVKR